MAGTAVVEDRLAAVLIADRPPPDENRAAEPLLEPPGLGEAHGLSLPIAMIAHASAERLHPSASPVEFALAPDTALDALSAVEVEQSLYGAIPSAGNGPLPVRNPMSKYWMLAVRPLGRVIASGSMWLKKLAPSEVDQSTVTWNIPSPRSAIVAATWYADALWVTRLKSAVGPALVVGEYPGNVVAPNE